MPYSSLSLQHLACSEHVTDVTRDGDLAAAGGVSAHRCPGALCLRWSHTRVFSVAGPHLCEPVLHTDVLLTHCVAFLTVTHSYIFWFPRYHVDLSMFIAVG